MSRARASIIRSALRPKRAAGAALLAGVLAISASLAAQTTVPLISAATTLPLVSAGTTLLGAAHHPSPTDDPGIYLGPTHVASVSFLVLLHSATKATCLVRWAGSAGLSVQWSRGQRWAVITGSPRNVDRSFDVSIGAYRSPDGHVIFATDHPARVPRGACGEIAGVGAIHSFVAPTDLVSPPQTSALVSTDRPPADERLWGATGGSRYAAAPQDVPQGALSPVDLMRAYDALPLAQQGYAGQGQTVVFIETSGFDPSDLTKFASMEDLPGYNLTLVGKNPSPAGEAETPMDLETVHEIAPDAHLVFVNLADEPASSIASALVMAITGAAKTWPRAVFTASLGWCEDDQQLFDRADLVAVNSAVASVEAAGSTMFASSGDSGGLDCTPYDDAGQAPQASFVGVSVPAVLPAVTGTGGTSLTTDADGNYVGETTWSEPLLAQGSGGGVSDIFLRPSWQTGLGTGGQFDTHNGRQVPDVSADSDPATGNFFIGNGQAQTGGGTSLASPMWAGFTVLMNQFLAAHHHRPVGFFNPILYHLANSQEAFPPFHDITVGGNDYYLATPGYDMVTGLGSPDVWNLAQDLSAGGF